jgi:ATP-dependent Lhr-like helicase
MHAPIDAGDPLEEFHPLVRTWFRTAMGVPTPAQKLGWPSIAAGNSTLILAPTGSGKTLAAFLWAINHIVEQHLQERLLPGVRILYVSPLKALNNDIEKNLQIPLAGIAALAEAQGVPLARIRSAVRTGDTPARERTAMVRRPPDILITTPESLYLMLTSPQARKIFATVQYLIVDEIHSICGNKRGVHLSLSMERLERIAAQEIVRIGLSATQRPLERVAAFLGGMTGGAEDPSPRPVAIIDAGRKKEMNLSVECVVPDFSLLPQEGVWPILYGEILRQIRLHRTTLIFVNNRRQAERLAAKLNQLLGDPDAPSATNDHAVPFATAHGPSPESAEEPPSPPFVVRAYHGSMSRAARQRTEDELKRGELRALVATSSLELGIDIGSIDLVLQVQSPKGVARGLQRVGRSGHLVTATSKGRIFPTHREDLVESAVLARAMVSHEVEETSIPENCLDILAQQIVAMVSVEPWDTDELFECVRQSYCYRNLSRNLYSGVLRMLAGRYSDEMFRELQPRISWDKVNNTLRALPGSGRLAILGGGAIVDKGAFAVYLPGGKVKIGEVDEEFVFETRVGDTFLLGTQVWRVLEMDANRLIVESASGHPARMPFWRGEGIARSIELGSGVGAFRREMSDRMEREECLLWLQREFPVDSRSAWNIQEYFRKQKESTGVIPSDRVFLIESFRDELGDPRIVLHSSYGRKVNNMLGLVLARLLQERTGVEGQMFANDDGVLLRCSDVESIPTGLLEGLSVEAAEKLVMEELLSSPLFGGQFRQNAARALLLPRRAPGKRTPLWLQRLRAGDLLEIARRHDDFPIVIETVREVLNDVLDFNAFREIIRKIQHGEIVVRTAATEVPSPFSASLLFDFIAVYMYEHDQPRGDRLSQYVALNRELLSEITDTESIAGVIRPEAIQAVEAQLQHTAEGYRARSPEELMELLLRVGDLSEAEILNRCAGDGRALLALLESDGRAVRVEFPDGTRWVAGEEDGLYRELRVERNLSTAIRRYIEHHGPVTSAELARRYGGTAHGIDRLAGSFAQDARIIRGHFLPDSLPGSGEVQWCYRPNVERIHRQTLTILRREIKPCSIADFTRFLERWQHVHPSSRLAGEEGLLECLDQLQGFPLPTEVWVRDILPLRVRTFDVGHLDRLAARGEVVWTGSGPGRMIAFLRGSGSVVMPEEPASGRPAGDPARRILSALEKHGAVFFTDLRGGTGLSLSALNNGISQLLWSGQITNDIFAELMNVKRPAHQDGDTPSTPIQMLSPQHNAARANLMRVARKSIRQVPGWSGRWSLVRSRGVMGKPLALEEKAAGQTLLLLRRYGVVARELCRHEEFLPWPLLAAELQRLEMRGEVRRGCFVEGFAGMQYAMPEAVEELRALVSQETSSEPLILMNMCDPALPYGGGIPARKEGLRFARIPSTFLALLGGKPVVAAELYGRRLWTLNEGGAEHLPAVVLALLGLTRLPSPLRPSGQIELEYIDGDRPAAGPYCRQLESMGFRRDRDQTMVFDGYA